MKTPMLTTYIIGNKEIILDNIPENVEIIKFKDIKEIDNAKGKYISFIDSEDKISPNYFNLILEEINKSKFDICYLNFYINYEYKRKPKIRTEKEGLNNLVPVYKPYIWNYVFKKNKLLKIKKGKIKLKDLEKTSYISEPIYFHNQCRIGTTILGMTTRRTTLHYKNIIYMGGYCNTVFNGYISWLLEIGKAFAPFEMVILYTKIHPDTKKRLSKYYTLLEYNQNYNYTCNRLFVTYSTYFYPNNIFSLEESYLFIHGNMNDYTGSRKFSNDIYERYIAVSKTSMKKAKGYFPTDNIEYIYNPYTHDPESIKPHLTLVSALRNAPEKGMDRIKQVASILDEENIPYTWSVFTDILEPNQGGLIFRKGIPNVRDYIADADYMVQLSRSEALSYSLVEALASNTKLLITTIPSAYELDLKDGINSILIPLRYFEERNKHLLKQKVLEAYRKKDIKINYKYEKSRFKEYQDLISK